tara:strand:+ start:114 stop:719 length:606 start_codon:yes stop_codon:yes gene_type:complete
MTPSQIQLFLNEINGIDDEDTIERKINNFSKEVDIEYAKRFDGRNLPSDDWYGFSKLWTETYYDWIKSGKGILLMYCKDSDNVYPYVWWYIGYDIERGLYESSSWLVTGDFYTPPLGTTKVETCNWSGKDLLDLNEKVCAYMLQWNDDWQGVIEDEQQVEWANCATGLNVWKMVMSLKEFMENTPRPLNWSQANIKILLGD